MKIKMLRNTYASGKSVSIGQILSVPTEISEQDAGILVRIGKAAIVPPEESKAPQTPEALKTENKKPAVPKPGDKKDI